MPPTPEELDLILRAQQGGADGQQAFRSLVRLHEAWLVRYLYYVLRDMSAADDVAQEVLLKAYEGLPLFRATSSFRTWLRTIATRLAFNHRRDASTRRRYEDQVPSSVLPGLAAEVEARDALLKLLDELSYPYREILLLRHVEELSIEEIAVTLDIGTSAAKMRLKRARDSFLALYQGEGS
jgi:RNA polymerase sigma-70 factor (ECF subfamily)